MKTRLNYIQAAPTVFKAQLALSNFSHEQGLEPSLIELVKIRASQLNGCAYCLEMHTREARAAGETDTRLHLLAAWEESPLYTDRERAALAWTEAVTLVATSRVPDAVYEKVRAQFSEEELVKLTLAIAVINSWNRFAVSFRAIHPLPAKN
ncbi:carboxymuconolactone decarboxylase family protein [Oleiharenicola lentus]|uniref:carboxymuconolactone decarboxylase family protein n=1 Tax=Oleiharenicola lentus TaxID=2508720 RepID=UPI003F6748D6